MVDQVPAPEEAQLPSLPERPDDTTMVAPSQRLRRKVTFQPGDYVDKLVGERLRQVYLSREVNDHDDLNTTTTRRHRRPKSLEQTTLRLRCPRMFSSERRNLELAQLKSLKSCIYSIMEEVNDFLKAEFDFPAPESNRQRKTLERNLVVYLVKKTRGAEVSISKLGPQERGLFTRAKGKEVKSFLANEAVRKCMDNAEVKKA